jgi:hypothetical protein
MRPYLRPPIRLRELRREVLRICAEQELPPIDVDARLQELIEGGRLDRGTELALCLTLAIHSTQKPCQQRRW